MIRLLAALILAANCLAAAQGAANLDVTATADKPQITVGDVLTYTVVVTCPEGTRVNVQDPAKAVAPFEVRDASQRDEQREGKHVVVLTYQLVVFEVGERQVGGLPLECTVPGGGKAQRMKSPAVKVTGASVLDPGAQDIKDIRGPVPVHMSKREWLALVLGLLLLAALVAAVWVALRRRRRRAPKAAPGVVVGAHERALRELEELRQSKLLSRGDLKGYYTRLGDILREYLEARFGIPAMEETTWMIRRDLERQGVAREWREELAGLLQGADMVKFAREDASDRRAEDDLARAQSLVLASRPAPTGVGEGGAAVAAGS